MRKKQSVIARSEATKQSEANQRDSLTGLSKSLFGSLILAAVLILAGWLGPLKLKVSLGQQNASGSLSIDSISPSPITTGLLSLSGTGTGGSTSVSNGTCTRFRNPGAIEVITTATVLGVPTTWSIDGGVLSGSYTLNQTQAGNSVSSCTQTELREFLYSFSINSLNVSSLSAGSHTIVVSAVDGANPGSTVTASANFTIPAPPPAKPTIALSPTAFSFTGVSGQAQSTPTSQTLNIGNTGQSTLSYNASTNQNWCFVNGQTSNVTGTVQAGAAANTVNVTVGAPSVVGTFTCTITVSDPNATNSPQTATVTYTVTPQAYTLTVSKAGQGTGTVNSSPPDTSINCGSVCTKSYSAGTLIALNAIANTPTSSFGGWSLSNGSSCPGTGSCNFTLDSNIIVTATFNPVFGPGATLTANPTSVNYNGSSTLSWTCTNSESGSISPALPAYPSGSVPFDGQEYTSPTSALIQSTIYKLTCTKSGFADATASKTIGINTGTINVQATKDGSPWSGAVSYDLHGPASGDPAGDFSGSSVSQTFNNKYAGFWLIAPGGPPPGTTLSSVTPSSSLSLPANGDITFTMNFTSIPPPTVTLLVNGLATPPNINYKGSATVTWDSQDATSCTASGGPPGWAGSKPLSNLSPGLTFSNLTNPSYSFTLSCTGSGGTTNKQVTLGVNPPPRSYDFTLSVLPNAPASGNVYPGGTVSYTVNTGFCNQGYTGPINNFTVSGLPAGVSVQSFSPTSVACGGSTTLTLLASSSAAPTQGAPFTVTGTGQNVGSRSGNSTVIVNAKPSLTVTPICNATLTQNDLAWSTVSFSNGYSIYRNNSQISSTNSGTRVSDATSAAGSSNSYFVRASLSLGGTVDTNTVTVTSLYCAGTLNVQADQLMPDGTTTAYSGPLSFQLTGVQNYSGFSVPFSNSNWPTGAVNITVPSAPAGYSLMPTPVTPPSGSSVSGNGTLAYTVHLRAVTYTLSVSKAGTGSGTVTSSDAKINCGATCSASYASGASAGLSATASPGSVFSGWSADCSGSGACSLTMSANHSVTATFEALPGGFLLDPPSSPAASTAPYCSGTTSQVQLSWNNSAGATSYDVYRDGSLVGPAASPYVDKPLTPGTAYAYFIRASNSVGFTDSNTQNFTARFCTGDITVNSVPQGASYTLFGPTSIPGVTNQAHLGAGLGSWNLNINSVPAGYGFVSVTPAASQTLASDQTTKPTATFTVNLAPLKPTISLSPSSFTFNGTSGGPTPGKQLLTISNTGDGALNFKAQTDQAWCRVNNQNNTSQITGSLAPHSFTNPLIDVSVDAPSNTGSFACAISVSDPNASNSPQTASVTYNVSGGPATGTIRVNWTKDGAVQAASTFAVQYQIANNTTGTTPVPNTTYIVGRDHTLLPVGSYTFTHVAGIPSGYQKAAAFITPSPTQDLVSGGTTTFTMNFVSTGGGPSINLTGPVSEVINQGFVVSWTSTNASSVVSSSFACGSGPVSGSAEVSGSRTVACPTVGNKTFSITVQDSAGRQATGSAVVQIVAVPPFTLNPPTTSCAAATSQVSLSWTNASPATRYDLYRDGVLYASNLTSPYTDSSVISGISYSYFVRASNTSGFADSNTQSVTATWCTGEITVNATLNGSAWPTTGTGSLSYTLFGPSSIPGALVPQTHTSLANGSWDITNISGGPSGANLQSINPPTVRPAPLPGNVASKPSLTFTLNFTNNAPSVALTAPASAQVNSPFNVSWTSSNATNVVSYSFACGAGPGASEVTGFRSVTCSVGGAATFSLTVRSASGQQASDSKTVNITPASFTLDPPASPAASTAPYCSGTTSQVSLSWSNSAGATSYDIWRDGSRVKQNATSPYVDSPLTPGTVYVYLVKALAPGGSADSNTQSFTARFCTGDITVRATLDDNSWSGNLSYQLLGPTSGSGSTVANTNANMLVGTYSAIRNSGGPSGANYSGDPAPQSLASGLTTKPTLTFTLAFTTAVPGPSVSLVAPASANKNQAFTISWTSSNASAVASSSFDCGAPSAGVNELNGSRSVTCGNSSTASFTITVRNASGQQATDTKVVDLTNGNGGNPPGGGGGGPADFSLSVTPLQNTVQAGQSASYTVTATNCSGSFDGKVINLQVLNPPQGTTVTFASSNNPTNSLVQCSPAYPPPPPPNPSDSATLTISTDVNTPPSTNPYSFTVQGRAKNFALTHTAASSITVQEPAGNKANLSTSDIDITRVNGNNVTASACSGATEALGSQSLLQAGDILNLKLNICNSGNKDAKIRNVAVTLTNLAQPPAGFNATFKNSAIIPQVGQTGGKTTLTFDLNNAPVSPSGGVVSLAFNAKLVAPSGASSGLYRFQSTGVITENNNSTTLVSTPLLLFQFGVGTPQQQEIAP